MSPRKKPSPPDPKLAAKWTWATVLIGIVALAAVFGLLDGPWIGVLVGSVFLLLGMGIVVSIFGPYSGNPFSVLIQAPLRLVAGAVFIFLGGLGLVSAISDLRPSLIWNYPNFGDLRTLFWDRDDYRAMACERVEDGPPAALRYAVQRTGLTSIDCPRNDGSRASLLELVDDPELFQVVVENGRFDQRELDRKLVAEAWSGAGHRMQVEKLVALGANPNAEIDGWTALAAALESHGLQLAMWLLENGAQASHTFANGETLLERAQRVDQVQLRQPYQELLLSHGATEPPKLEQTPMGR